ncbi:MAG: dihydroorotase [Gammaproteobacteria bacterium]|nr:dihydroorotase [Gammaproteobacteria bacterium]
MKTIITNGLLFDSQHARSAKQNIYIENNLIISIEGEPENFTADQVIDAEGCWILPGLVDLKVRIREPGYTRKATLASETRAAALNGITSICIPPDSSPSVDHAALVDQIHHNNLRAGNQCHIYIVGALTKNLNGEILANMASLKNRGCVAVTNSLYPMHNNLIQRRAMEYASGLNLTVVIQPIDHSLMANGCAHESAFSTRYGLAPIPEAAETAALAKDIELVAQTGAKTHFGQLSCARSVEMIRQAKQNGLPITADCAIHQLFLTDQDIAQFDTNKHVIPPFRSQRDKEALRAGLADGTIDCLCSDHQPHELDAKLQPFPSSEPGVSSLDSYLPLAFKLVDEGVLSKELLVQKITYNPAQIFSLPAGKIEKGELADICIVKPDELFQLETEKLISAGKNNAFINWNFSYKVIQTLVAGKLAKA